MTVADKLVYLSETKDILADAINSYTQVITPDTPFREYAQWIDNIVFSAEGGIPSLFDGEAGFAWSGLPYYQDPAGTTVASWGDPVGLISDDSGNGADFTQPTVTARPILRNDPPRLEFDLVDDLLQTTLPAITNGTLVLAGTNGIWIDDDFNHAGGAFAVGPTTYTGGPEGILPIVGDLIVGGSFAIDRQLTAQERERVISKLKSMGAPGVFELGPELIVNGDFSDGLEGWVTTLNGGTITVVESGLNFVRGSEGSATISQNTSSPISGYHLAEMVVAPGATGARRIRIGGSATAFIAGSGKKSAVLTGDGSRVAVLYDQGVDAGDQGILENISLRKLELMP